MRVVCCAGDIGNASKMNSVLQVVGGVSLAALAEGLALADRAGLNQADLLDVLALTPLASPHLILKGRGTDLHRCGSRYIACGLTLHQYIDGRVELQR